MAKRLGIKAKVWYACIVLGVVLLFSGFISLYEYSKMNDYVADVISDNINSINAARELLSVSEQYNINLMNDLIINNATDSIGKYPVVENERIISTFENLRKKFVTAEERNAADSVVYAYAAYMQVVADAEMIWQKDYKARQQWFFNRLQPVYMEFRSYMMKLTQLCQDTLVSNSAALQDGFYRSLMPGVVSVIFGFIMVFLMGYYIIAFLVKPVLKITKGINDSRHFGKTYDVKVESDDEIGDLNTTVKDMVDLNQSYKKQLQR